jgi:hypothetical protein
MVEANANVSQLLEIRRVFLCLPCPVLIVVLSDKRNNT